MRSRESRVESREKNPSTRHALATLVLAALIAPLIPAAWGAPMACCRGKGEACACPVEPGFARCDVTPSLSPLQAPPAVLPPEAPPLSLFAAFEAPVPSAQAAVCLARRPLVPPPRF